ncbi:hypothetical protein [Sphingomonas sanxanigenens]|uniref:Uncharacterized protein n=1 Tax=Sphingomonas sanxanigenens DSM 19645 = NX02 TaxID=1123269 RepID=W0ADK0_9SPHN|nr:hypothetical protein [Sphingomonas sanxanigenens]AHE54383.1 hypothetical protein NX02_13445 [Sphingomonas sanxanigenens DSM 19645 = NX02]
MTTTLPHPRTTLVRILVPALLVAALLFLATRLFQTAPPPAPAPLPGAPPILLGSGSPQTYAEAVARADEAIDGAARRARHMPGQWLPLESLARAQFDRARLTGDLASYIAARDSFARAFEGLPPKTGPHLSRAEFALGTHDLAAASADLDAVEAYATIPEPAEQAEIQAMRGDIAFYRGDYSRASRHYRAAAATAPATGIDVRLATRSMRLGRFDEALRLLDLAEREAKTITPQILARIELQRGMIERARGDWPAATRHFDKALAVYPGWWLAEQQRAAMAALAGDIGGAIRRFQALATRSGLPEPMDALAALYRVSGDSARSRAWAARAGALWDARVAAFPAAFAQHAIDHHLAFGDPDRALRLARQSFAARPFGETAIALAASLIATGYPDRAIAVLAEVDRTGWVSAEQHLLAAQALAMLGRGADAEAERARAQAIDPHSSDRNPALLWFDH